MVSKRNKQKKNDPVLGAEMLRQVFPMLGAIAHSGTERDKSKNRQLLFSQYAALVLVGLFNPVVNSARALVASSGLKKVRKITGGKRVSLGSFSEATSVFDPHLLEGIVKSLRLKLCSKLHQEHHLKKGLSGSRVGEISNELIERLVAVDGSVLNALPQVMGQLGRPHKGQWRLHAQVRVLDGTVLDFAMTEEPASKGQAERDVMARMLVTDQSENSSQSQGSLFLMDRGYRSAGLFNKIHAAGHDYICRLNRTDGRVVDSAANQDGGEIVLPSLSNADKEWGVIADELITLGGKSGASKIGSNHPIRRITLIPPAGRSSSARQGRVRSDQSGRDELILATTLYDLPAEQIVMLYEHRWQVELFFRFLKHVLGCDKLLSAKTKGVEIQLYCAIIASLLLALATGGNVSRRNFEMICLYFSGWADEEELLESLTKHPP